MKKVTTILFVLSAFFNVIASAHDSTVAAQDSVTVTGEGFVDAEPDMLDLRVDLFAIKPTLKAAKAELDQRYREALKVIKNYKIADADVKLTRLNSQTEYDWNKQQRVFKGYRVSRNLQVSVRDLGTYPELLQSLVNANISNINNATPRFSDDTATKEQALAVAVASAKRKAESLAAQFNRRLGQVAFISEGQVNASVPRPMMAKSRSMTVQSDILQAAPPAMLGTQRINARVTVVYRLQ